MFKEDFDDLYLKTMIAFYYTLEVKSIKNSLASSGKKIVEKGDENLEKFLRETIQQKTDKYFSDFTKLEESDRNDFLSKVLEDVKEDQIILKRIEELCIC